MLKDAKIVSITAFLILSLLLLVPTFTGWEPSWWPASKVNLGLDLQGGMHVVLAVEVDKALRDELTHQATVVESVFKDKSINLTKAYYDDNLKALAIDFPDDAARTKARSYLADNWTDYKIDNAKSTSLALTMKPNVVAYIKENALKQARETIENRVDEFNVREPEIYTQGGDQIVVRLPGVVDPGRAKQLIGRTAALEFKLVTDKATYAPTKEALLAKFNGQVPEGYDVYVGKGKASSETEGFWLLRKTPEMTGAYLIDARTGYDDQGGFAVDFGFNEEGARKFGVLTEKNIDKPLAIVLDNVVYSAPVIRSRISNRGQITGNFAREEALDLAIVLRAGALPVPVRIDEERTIGATLGEDSIHKGTLSFLIGGIAVILFMGIYYRKVGWSANLALILNVLMIMAGLAMFGATLTLPGIAGIILTIGMAVDANVLINERIREELRSGKTPISAVNMGYARALWTILDSNITTLIAAIVLYNFGTGAIKGFAVTLTIGLTASVFTSIVVSRVVVDWMARHAKDTLSI